MTRKFNIVNGMTAQERVNVEKAREIGVKIVESMAGKSTDKFTIRKANEAVTLGVWIILPPFAAKQGGTCRLPLEIHERRETEP